MARLKLEDIKKSIENEGWQLLSDKYVNLSSQLHMVCPEKHDVYMSYDKFRTNPICPICARKHLDTKDNIERKPKKKGDFRILALDQATKVSGWSIFDNEKLVKYGFFATKDGNSDTRIEEMKNYLINMLDFWKPDKVILEDIQLQQFGNDSGDNVIGVTTYKTLAHLQGVLINTLHENNMDYELVHTAVWREGCGVKGKSRSDKKKSAQLIVKDIYDISVGQDEADAICIGLHSAKKSKKQNKIFEWG